MRTSTTTRSSSSCALDVFRGDVESEGEAALVVAGLPPVDIVKVAHHGSPTSSSPALVAATHPRVAVISCGRDNRFHVARWRATGADVVRTDFHASVVITIDPDGTLRVR